MTEKRFSLQSFYPTVAPLKKEYFISDIENEYDSIRSLGDCVYVLNDLNNDIAEVQSSDRMGWGRAIKFEKKLEQKKIYIKRLEYKVQKFKEMNGEQQATINKLKEENEQLKKEKEGWKLSTCRYINKDSVLMMDCQIVYEALFELESLIEADTEQMERFNDLKDKFKNLVNHYLGVFDV